MDSVFAMAMGMASKGNPLKVFDWKKCAEIIRDEKPQEVEAGLSEDWEYTGGVIFKDGEIVEDEYTYLASSWATPMILVDGCYRDCYVMQSETEWHCGTKWPNEAKSILAAVAARERKEEGR